MVDGVMLGLRARSRSGLSRMRRVLRWVEGREDMAVVSVFWRCARSRDLSACWFVGGRLALVRIDVFVGVEAGCAAACGGPLVGTIRPGGPRTGGM